MHRGLPRELGVERDGQQAALAHGDRVAVDLGEHLDRRAAVLDPGARMKTACTARPSSSRSVSKECVWRPNALRRQVMSIRPRWARSSMIIPAHVPSTGRPLRANSRSGPASPSRSMPSVIVVDSPPGMTSASSPSRSAGTRTSRTSSPSPRRIAAWAAKPPWRASVPTNRGRRAARTRRACASRATASAGRGPPTPARRARRRRSASSPRRSPVRGAPGRRS